MAKQFRTKKQVVPYPSLLIKGASEHGQGIFKLLECVGSCQIGVSFRHNAMHHGALSQSAHLKVLFREKAVPSKTFPPHFNRKQ